MVNLNEKIVLIIDPSNKYYNQILTVYEDTYIDFSSNLGMCVPTVWKIKGIPYPWFWKREFIEGKLYIDVTHRMNKLLAFV